MSNNTRGRGERKSFSMNTVSIHTLPRGAFETTTQQSKAKPLVSVVIPTYNRGALIAQTIESVLAQDLPPESVEIIIVDDGSTDETFDILQRLYSSHGQVRLFQTSNGGVAAARNFGVEQARGEFIAFLDHDDLWLPQKLRLQLERIQNDVKVGRSLQFVGRG